MQRIASLAISGSRKGGVRSETGTYVTRTIPSDRQERGSRGEIGNSRYALPSLPSGTRVEAETRTTVSGSTDGKADNKRSGLS